MTAAEGSEWVLSGWSRFFAEPVCCCENYKVNCFSTCWVEIGTSLDISCFILDTLLFRRTELTRSQPFACVARDRLDPGWYGLIVVLGPKVVPLNKTLLWSWILPFMIIQRLSFFHLSLEHLIWFSLNLFVVLACAMPHRLAKDRRLRRNGIVYCTPDSGRYQRHQW